MRTTLKIEFYGEQWRIEFSNRALGWLFGKLYTLEVSKILTPKEARAKKGRVVKSNQHAEYSPEPKTGGRVVKIMPKQLKKIKEAQENVRPV